MTLLRKIHDFVLEVAGWILSMGFLVTVLSICWTCQGARWLWKVVGRVVGFRGSK